MLLLNFTWWVNRKDRSGRNVFEGGASSGSITSASSDRKSAAAADRRLLRAGHDGTAWMALFCQNMLEIAAELADVRPRLRRGDGRSSSSSISSGLPRPWVCTWAATRAAMWTQEVMASSTTCWRACQTAGRSASRCARWSGLLPLCAASTFDGHILQQYSRTGGTPATLPCSTAGPIATIHDPNKAGVNSRAFARFSTIWPRRVLAKLLDEHEFLSEFGIRSLSRFHADHPFVFHAGGQEYQVAYLPAESDTGMFGGNSNWRGPIWMPVNGLIVRALLQYYATTATISRSNVPPVPDA